MARTQSGEDTRASQSSTGQSPREMQRRNQGQQQQGQRGMQQRRQQSGSNLVGSFGLGPFSLIRRMQEDFDRLLSNTFIGQEQRGSSGAMLADFEPSVETMQRGNEFVIRMDLPGVDADSVEVDIADDAVTIGGERTIEREDERDGVYVSEIAYGSFERVVPLPAGAVVDNATARLVNGVLEVVVPAPSQEARRGRRLDIQRTTGERPEGAQPKRTL